MTRAKDISKILTDADISGDIDVDGVTNLDVVDVDGTLNVQGETTLQTHLNMGDGDIIKLGDGADLQIYHDGSNSSIVDNGTGEFLISTNGNFIRLGTTAGEAMIDGVKDGAATLYHNNVAKLATSSTGVNVTGTADSTLSITAGGTSNDSLINFVHGSTTDGGITYDHNGAYASEVMQFRTGNNTANMTLNGAGTLTVANGLTLTDGNLVVASGHGIDFSANSNASGMSSELLDDYEEGTWTPAYNVGSNGYATQVGKYTKIGQQVTAYFFVQLNNNQIGANALQLAGLPFTSLNVADCYGATSTIHCNSWAASANKPDNGLIAPNSTRIDLYHSQGTTGTSVPTGANLGTGSLIGLITYKAA